MISYWVTDDRGIPSYLRVAKVVKLLLEIVDSVEDGGILLQEINERFGVSLGLALCDLAKTAGLVLGQVPVHLADLAGRELGDASGASAVVTSAAPVHVGEDELS